MGSVDPSVREVLREFRHELDEHRDELNRTAEESAEVHDYIADVEIRLEKLAERVDALQALILAQTHEPRKAVRLSVQERSVLHVLLNRLEPITSDELARRCGLTSDVAAQMLFRMKQKGVPVVAQMVHEAVFYDLDPVFRRENSVGNINEIPGF